LRPDRQLPVAANLSSNFFYGAVSPRKKPKHANDSDAHEDCEQDIHSQQKHLNLLDLTVNIKPRRRLNDRQPGISGDFAAK
jgi:hypothetical protein